jgi:hypothetical protein
MESNTEYETDQLDAVSPAASHDHHDLQARGAGPTHAGERQTL